MFFDASHCDLKVSRSQAKINENFANYFFKTKANNKCVIVQNVHVKGYRKALVSWAVKSKLKALRHFKVDPVFKIDETVYKQTESMYIVCMDATFFGMSRF